MPVEIDEIIQSTDLSTCTVKIEGEEIAPGIQITKIIVGKAVNKIPYARLYIIDGDPATQTFAISNTESFIPGKNIEILMGYQSDDQTIFNGIIIQHNNSISEYNSELIIECRDKAVKMTIAKKNKHYNDATDSDIAEEIISSYGLESDVESSNITHKDLVQYEITDWDFMLSRMDVIGKMCFVNDGKISFKKPALNSEAVFNVTFGNSLSDFNASIDARNQIQSLSAKSWSFSNQDIENADAEEPAINKEPGNISNTGISNILGIDDYKLIHSGKLQQEELQAWADAKMMKHRLSKIAGSIKFQGYSQLQPGMFIALNGVGDRFSGPVFVNDIKHEYKNGDWQTEAGFGLTQEWYSQQKNPYSTTTAYGRMSNEPGLLIGIVTGLEDPDGENRVKIKIPVISTEEDGIWARIATLDAGNNRGSFFLPEIGDEVIVGFIQSDVSHAVILGMLNSSAKPAPLTAANQNNEKGYVSREQIKMIFNDDEKSLKIETPAGKKVMLSEQDAIIKIEDENGNSITMDSNGITINAATALTLKAGTSVKIEAPGISVNGSTTTEIKGGIVKIN